MKYSFVKVEMTGIKNVNCSICGDRLKKQKKFYQTLNPFNKDKSGFVKNEKQIRLELQEEIKKWEKKPEICFHCRGTL